MSITRYFKIVTPTSPKTTVGDNVDITGLGNMYGSYGWYHRLVTGSAQRISRYREYDLMDADIDVAVALDLIAEEITGNNVKGELPFRVEIVAGQEQFVHQNTVVTLNAALRTWCNIYKWHTRLFSIARNTVKYGDIFYIKSRNGKNKIFYVNPKNVYGAIVREDDVTETVGWEFRLDYSAIENGTSFLSGYGLNPIYDGGSIAQIKDEDVLRFTLYQESDDEAPFGRSILYPIFKTFKQKELLEDSILIYRIQRAPEKRVFYVDVGNMPPQQRQVYLERFKNDIKQRKVPMQMGNSPMQVESVYNPMSQQEDYFLGVRADGTGSKIEVLPGGQNLGSLEDLEYFYKKMWRGLRVPESFINSSAEGGGVANDGKVGIAYLQEVKFSLYMERIQRSLEESFDKFFKEFLRDNKINVDESIFKIVLPPPSNYEASRKQLMDADLLSNYSTASGITELSRRFALRKYLQLDEGEIKLNERLKREELGLNVNGDSRDLPKIYNPDQAELGGFEGGFGGSSGGLTGGGGMPSFGGDMGGEDELDLGGEGETGTATDEANLGDTTKSTTTTGANEKTPPTNNKPPQGKKP
jgi:hypothetical protein